MAYAPTVAVYPSERRSLGIAKELASAPGTGVLPTATVPVKGFVPEDKVTGLLDESLRSAMAGVYSYIQGPYVADVTIDASPVYGDTIGHFLLNILGDYTVTGTASTPTWAAPGGAVPGAGPITVTSATSAVAGTFIQIGSGTTAEIVTVGTGSTATSIVISASTPIRFTHTGSTTITTVIAPFTHVFSLLNGTGNAQPPTHTITDNNYINSVFARWYPFFRVSELTLTGNAEQLLTWSCKGMGFANVIPGSIPAVSVSTVATTPAWNSQVGIGGTVSSSPVYNAMEWSHTITRVVEPYFTASGQQNPYTIGAGKLTAAGKINFGPAAAQAALGSPYNAGDWELLEYLNNNQPQMQTIATNGLSGASLVKLQVDTQVAAFDSSVIEASKALLGYNSGINFTANTTNTGNSAGYGPIQITLVNGVSSY